MTALNPLNYVYAVRFGTENSDAADLEWFKGKRIMRFSITIGPGSGANLLVFSSVSESTPIALSENQTLCLEPNGSGVAAITIVLSGGLSASWVIEAWRPV